MIKRQHSTARMSQLVRCGHLIWTAGQVAQDPTADISGQTRQVLEPD